ncbi:hypothetical protein [Rosistilla oblonga]|uniref:hypothetical protein n=1 Tax=Rosistilla oblonga TaxID=2527990 RepID=UPI003A98822D
MAAVQVMLAGFPAFVRLEGVDGASSVQNGRLVGAYRMSVSGKPGDTRWFSRPSVVGEGGAPSQVEVIELSAGIFRLHRHFNWLFLFDDPEIPSFTSGSGEAALAFNAMGIETDVVAGERVTVASFDRDFLSIGMCESAPSRNWGSFRFPARTNSETAQVGLDTVLHPKLLQLGMTIPGRFLFYDAAAESIQTLFSFSDHVVLDHTTKYSTSAADVFIDTLGAGGKFHVATGEGKRLLTAEDVSLEIYTVPNERAAAFVRAKHSSHCRLPRAGAAMTLLEVSSLQQRGRWLESICTSTERSQFNADSNGELEIRQGAAAVSGAGSETMSLFSNVARLGLHVPIYRPSDLPEGCRLHFSYRDPALSGANIPERLTRRTRSYGIRLGGLGSNKTGSTTLDSSLAILELFDDGSTQRFRLRAGSSVSFRGVEHDSRLVPKSNPTEGHERIEDIPVDGMMMRLQADVGGAPDSPYILDTSAPQQLVLQGPLLLSPPAGATSHKRSGIAVRRLNGQLADDLTFARWTMALGGSRSMRLTAADGEVFPENGDQWSEPFETAGQKEFDLTDLQGVKVAIDDTQRLRQLATLNVDRTRVTQKEVAGEKRPHYKDILLQFDFKKQKDDAFNAFQVIKQQAIVLAQKEVANLGNAVIEHAVSDLLLVFSEKLQTVEPNLKEFVKNQGLGEAADIYWPITSVMGAMLFDKASRQYAHKIVKALDGNSMPAFALNWSAQYAFKPTEQFGYDEPTWMSIAENDPALWPKSMQLPAEKRPLGSRLDPSHGAWRGFFFRDIPLRLMGNLVQCGDQNADPLTRLICVINQYLVMDYGWLDDTGWTWKAKLRSYGPAEQVNLVPDWKDYVEMILVDFETKGSGGTTLTADGRIRIKFPSITDENDDPISFEGSFSIDPEKPGRLKEAKIALENPQTFVTESLPGFESITVKRLETDIETSLNMEFTLNPDDKAGSALPLLNPDNPIEGKFNFNFRTGKPSGEIRIPLVVPSEKQSNLFGGLPFSIQSILFVMKSGGSHLIEIHGRLNLGVAGFGSVAGVLTLERVPGGEWKADFTPDKLEGKLDLGGLKVFGAVEWKKYLPETGGFDSGAVTAGQLVQAKGRSLWGQLDVSGLFDTDLKLYLNVGSQQEVTYWAGAILSLDEKGWDLGPAKLKQPCLVLAHRADHENRIADSLTDLASDEFSKIFPPGIKAGEGANKGLAEKWLSKWRPSSRVGTMLAASAFLEMEKNAAAAAGSDRNTQQGKLTTIAFTDSGMVRASGFVSFFGLKELGVAFSHDPKLKRFMVGLQLPTFGYPSEQSPTWSVGGGRIIVGLGYGRGDYFSLRLGWPPLTGEDEYERDWSQSIKIVWNGFWPINTFWGGTLVEYEKNPTPLFRFGVALRAGWTCDYGVTAGIAEGGVHVEIAFGGVVQLDIYASGPQRGMVVQPAPIVNVVARRLTGRQRALMHRSSGDSGATGGHPSVNLFASRLRPCLEMIEPALVALNTVTTTGEIHVWLYGDIKGSAWAKLLGVTVASIDVHAYARFHGCGIVIVDDKGALKQVTIQRVVAKAGFDWEIKIGCVTHSGHAEFEVKVIDGECGGRSLLEEAVARRHLHRQQPRLEDVCV